MRVERLIKTLTVRIQHAMNEWAQSTQLQRTICVQKDQEDKKSEQIIGK